MFYCLKFHSSTQKLISKVLFDWSEAFEPSITSTSIKSRMNGLWTLVERRMHYTYSRTEVIWELNPIFQSLCNRNSTLYLWKIGCFANPEYWQWMRGVTDMSPHRVFIEEMVWRQRGKKWRKDLISQKLLFCLRSQNAKSYEKTLLIAMKTSFTNWCHINVKALNRRLTDEWSSQMTQNDMTLRTVKHQTFADHFLVLNIHSIAVNILLNVRKYILLYKNFGIKVIEFLFICGNIARIVFNYKFVVSWWLAYQIDKRNGELVSYKS